MNVNGITQTSSTAYFFEIDRVAPIVQFVNTPGRQFTPDMSIDKNPVSFMSFQSNYSGVSYKCKACVTYTPANLVGTVYNVIPCTTYTICPTRNIPIRNVLGDAGNGIAVPVTSVTSSLLTTQALSICAEGVLAGCSASDFHSGTGTCAGGFVRLCGYTSLSYHDGATLPLVQGACGDAEMASSDAARLATFACIRQAMYIHTLYVRGTDTAGNVGAEQHFSWIYDTVAPVILSFVSSLASEGMCMIRDRTPHRFLYMYPLHPFHECFMVLLY